MRLFHRYDLGTKLLVLAALALGVVAGAVANRWPAWVTTRHAYCTLCAMHREESERLPLLGRHRTAVVRGGVLAKLLGPAVAEHSHVWSPFAYVAPTNPPPKITSRDAFAQAVLEAEVRDLELLEESPHYVALLDEAMRNDRARALRFVQRILDPQAFLPADAVALLDRPGPWPERWAIVDAFLDAYHCDVTEVSASCRMRAGSTDLLVLVRTATSVHVGGLDWSHWVPPGMKPPPGGSPPSNYASITMSD